jgi:hypothetical protein
MPKAISSRSRSSRRSASPSAARTRRLRQRSALTEPAPIEIASDPVISQGEAIERSRKLIINAAPSITQAVIEQAKEGSYLHARMLFDFAGLTAAQAPEATSISPVLELLMQELEKPLPKLAAS